MQLRRTRSIGSAFLVLATLSVASPGSAQTSSTVQITAGTTLAKIPAMAFGINTAVWDGNLLDGAVSGLLTNAGISALRYPGGSTSDTYNWQTNSIVPNQGGFANANNGFDAFMGLVKSTGATPIITVNYGSNTAGNGGGTPAFAAAWVQYANKTKGYGVKYWEVGNEIYGNGEYGAHWETDLHSALDPSTYGTNVGQFASAMKAVDATIKVGAVLTAPGNWPDGQTPDWNTNVLAKCGTSIDFVIVHWYPQNPGSESDSGLLASPQTITGMVTKLKSLLTTYGGANAANIQILVTETNSVSSNPGKQTISVVNPLFIADNMMDWLEKGVTSVDVWALHNGSTSGNTSSSLHGTSTFGDYGILSDATSGEPPADTPFPTYYGMQMLSKLGKSGDAMVTASSSNSLLAVHAVRQAGGNLALLLINKDPANTVSASIAVSGYTPTGSATTFSYSEASTAIVSSSISGVGSSFTFSAKPYTLTVIAMTSTQSPPPPGFTLSAAPASLSLTQGGSGSATISVAPSGGFGGSVAFAASGLPSGVTASFTPVSSASSTKLTLNAGTAATTGASTVTISGSSGTLSASTGLSLTVNAGQSGGGGGTGTGAGPATFSGKAGTVGPWFDEDDVLLSTTVPITALTLTITVPATNAAFSSMYNTISGNIVGSHSSGAAIIYTFTSPPGLTISGGGTFAAQISGNGTQHDHTTDSWSLTYSAAGASYSQSGGFQ